ncbi:26S proteasome non-ATPase regulatory subunit 5 isoform X1 [Chanos chanos]|uniref:26S proteasome non-ATPase regulatory subunit 5 n=1 Tax=Chanos chanos TaxID=29144 RepID=A0A6J2UWY8_CHACN|nr:26S proteasome non-ATPase regulatory subunit 5 isoform X1 [Chanos chanos]
MAASIETLLSEISELEDPIDELKSLRTAVFSIPLSALRDTPCCTRLDVIFARLNTTDREQIDVCVEVLGRVLQAVDPVHVAQNCRSELQIGLNHPHHAVKVLTLTQIGRIVGNSEAVTQILNSPEILRNVIHCIREEKMSVAKELIVEISSVSPVSLGYCADSGFLSQLLGELTGDDVLVRVTAVEMVTNLAQSQHGRQYLSQQGIMDKISNMIIAAESDPFSSLYLPGLVKFFGNLAIMDSPQQVCENYPAFLSTVFSMAMNSDPTLTPVALDTLGVLGSTVEGKQVLHKTGEKFKSVLKRISQLARDGATELRVRSLEALALLLTLPVEQQTDDLLLLTESWFSCLSSQPMDMIRNISSQPFPELHCGALRIFSAIACQPWGQRLMVATPGFVEWVVDRSVGVGKEAKDCKFELVGALLSSSSTQEIMGAQTYLRLRTYLKEGPYYVNAVSSVTTEGAD